MEVGEDGLVERLEAATFGGGELAREGEGFELAESRLEATEIRLELERSRRNRRVGRGNAAETVERRAEKLAAVGLVGDAIRLDHPERFAAGEAVAIDGDETGGLLSRRDRRQGVGERRADRSLREPLLRFRRKPASEGQAPLDPSRFLPEKLRHPRWRVIVVVDEGADDARLVERGRRPRGSVRCQEEAFLLGGGERRLDDDGNQGQPRLSPAIEALEAVDDLPGSRLLRWSDPERKLRKAARSDSRSTGAERGVADPELLDGEKADRPSRFSEGRDQWWVQARRAGHDALNPLGGATLVGS